MNPCESQLRSTKQLPHRMSLRHSQWKAKPTRLPLMLVVPQRPLLSRAMFPRPPLIWALMPLQPLNEKKGPHRLVGQGVLQPWQER